MEGSRERELLRQLETVRASQDLLALLLLSLCLSWLGADRQGRWLEGALEGGAGEAPELSALRLPAAALAAGALAGFFRLSLDSWAGGGPRAERELWASLLVLAAALIRLYGLAGDG